MTIGILWPTLCSHLNGSSSVQFDTRYCSFPRRETANPFFAGLQSPAECQTVALTERVKDVIALELPSEDLTVPQKLLGSGKNDEKEKKWLPSAKARLQYFRRKLIASSSVGAGLFGMYRFTITATNTLLTAADYKFYYPKSLSEEGYTETVKAIHARSAKRVLRVCKSHGGVYTKLGQYISTMNHILPDEYTSTLAELTDRAASLPWEEISQVLVQDFFTSLPEVFFSHIDETPLAAASLAQVHFAVRRRDGAEVAVKLQYPHLRAQTRGDMKTLHILVQFIGWLFPDYEFAWLFPEFEQNLSHELDFRQEGFNAERVSRLLAERSDVHVPRIDWDLTSRRCLTMEFIRGFKVTDSAKLEAAGIDRAALADLVCDVFGKLLHVYGFIHCDPHPGNLLVRKQKHTDGAQLVLLDHGMYRRLEPSVRISYCELWKALLTQDTQLGKRVCRSLGIDESSLDIMSLIFTSRTTGSKFTNLGDAKMDPRDKEAVKKQFKDIQLADVNKFLHSLPRDILWVFRATNIVRSLNANLGGSTRSRLRITGYSVAEGMHVDRGIPTTNDEIVDLENRILDSWIARNLSSLDPDLLDNEVLFGQWWSNASKTGAVLGPLARSRIKRRVLERLDAEKQVSSQLPTKEPPLPPPVCIEEIVEFDKQITQESSVLFGTDSRSQWYQLPGAATLNLPVCSEVVRWKCSGYGDGQISCSFASRVWQNVRALIDIWLFNLKLWGFDFLFSFVEKQVDDIYLKISPLVPLEE